MKKIIFFVILITIITISCDRFKHDFKSDNKVKFENYVKEFADTLKNGLINSNINNILSFYSQNYLNNGWDINDIENYFSTISFLLNDSLEVNTEIILFDSLKFSYHLKSTFASLDTIIIDYSSKNNGGFTIIGNQKYRFTPQKVLVEAATGRYCFYCPYSSAALDSLKNEYGDNFYYIEYIQNDSQNDYGFSDILAYYGIVDIPYAIFLGQGHIQGGGENTYEEYKNTILSYMEDNTSVFLDNFEYEVLNDTLFCSLNVDIIGSISTDDLYIKYYLIDRISNYNNIISGEFIKQVPIAMDKKYIGDSDLSEVVNFNLKLPDEIPDDVTFYIWVQTLVEPYNGDICKIYNIIETNMDFKQYTK